MKHISETNIITAALATQEKGAAALISLLERMASEISEIRLLIRGGQLQPKDAPAGLPEPLMVSMKRASELSGLCVSSLYEMIRTKRLETRKVGSKRLVIYRSLKALMISQDVS